MHRLHRLAFLLIFALFISCGKDSSCAAFSEFSDTDITGTVLFTVTVDVTTSSYHGTYAPKNVFAVWVEKENGTYLKTLGVWAKNYQNKLSRWYQKSDNGCTGMVDAITGATRSTHRAETLTWDFIADPNNPPDDDRYIIYFELNESNSSSKQATATIGISGTQLIIESVHENDVMHNISITAK